MQNSSGIDVLGHEFFILSLLSLRVDPYLLQKFGEFRTYLFFFFILNHVLGFDFTFPLGKFSFCCTPLYIFFSFPIEDANIMRRN